MQFIQRDTLSRGSIRILVPGIWRIDAEPIVRWFHLYGPFRYFEQSVIRWVRTNLRGLHDVRSPITLPYSDAFHKGTTQIWSNPLLNLNDRLVDQYVVSPKPQQRVGFPV